MNMNSKLILDIINNSHEHLTADDIYLFMRSTGVSISLATIYNNLNKLYEEKLIQKVVIEGYPDRYDKTIRHDHLVCESCGKLSDITLEDLTSTLKAQLEMDFESYDLKINYICEDCKKKQNHSNL